MSDPTQPSEPTGPTGPSRPSAGVPRRPAPRYRFRVLAALVCGVEALVLAGFCVFYLWELTQGASDDPARVVVTAVLIALFAVGLGAVARGWWLGDNWPNTPTLVWNILLMPVAWSLVQSGRELVGAAVGVIGVTGIVAAFGADTSTDGETGDG